MAKSEQDELREFSDRNVCPNCGKEITGKRQLFGAGAFCSLDYYADYYRSDLIERAKKAPANAARHQNS